MSIADKLTQIAENEQKVYDSGYSKAEHDFWNAITRGGERTVYQYAFQYTDHEYIRPPFKIVPKETLSTSNMFASMRKLKKIEKKYIDFSQKPISETSAAAGYNYVFNACDVLGEIEDIGLQAEGYYMRTFSYCGKLRTIELIRTAAYTKFNQAFLNCGLLENLTIEGVIGQNGFNVQWSTELTHDSLMSIINALADYSADTSGTTWTVTLGSENIAKLTEEEQLIAYMKGWDIA